MGKAIEEATEHRAQELESNTLSVLALPDMVPENHRTRRAEDVLKVPEIEATFCRDWIWATSRQLLNARLQHWRYLRLGRIDHAPRLAPKYKVTVPGWANGSTWNAIWTRIGNPSTERMHARSHLVPARTNQQSINTEVGTQVPIQEGSHLRHAVSPKLTAFSTPLGKRPK